MHAKFSDPQKAGIFTVVVLVLAVAAALVINTFGLGSSFFAWSAVWSITPVLATVIMLLVSGMITVFSVTSAPLLVNGYLLGEFGILITAAAAIAAALISRLVPPDSVGNDSGTDAPPVPDRASQTTAMPQPDPH
jgi:hypothetical protein